MNDRIWLVGCGNMAGAMLSRWLATGRDPASVTVVRPSGAPVADEVRVLTQVPDEAPPNWLMLGMKPQQVEDVAPKLQAASRGATVVSILAGTRLAKLRTLFPAAGQIVRAMPNLPVALGLGVVGAMAEEGRDAAADGLFAPLGLVEWLDDEDAFDVVAALAGSGPAFVYRYLAAMTKAGTALGLDTALADRMARQTAAGAAAQAGNGDSFAAMIDRVASKGGSTRAGLNVLDDGLDVLIATTLAAATARNRELGG